ncbi:hypothetical protein F511_19995 [Dorcoceras hygrometricum]|uniref:Uncharacterized protein n=1 Tax=Dorcoceras hygrometricum TaxID=472368 RepID=A0A2Z7A9N4_9LAMI|nr:hypothetical protein F511_19995 [Dorcoceras hygrometricum]
MCVNQFWLSVRRTVRAGWLDCLYIVVASYSEYAKLDIRSGCRSDVVRRNQLRGAQSDSTVRIGLLDIPARRRALATVHRNLFPPIPGGRRCSFEQGFRSELLGTLVVVIVAQKLRYRCELHLQLFIGKEHCDVLSMQMDGFPGKLSNYPRSDSPSGYHLSSGESEHLRCRYSDLQEVCMAIESLTTLDLSMVVDSIGIYELKGPYYMLTMTDWFLQALSMIPRRSWGDVARRFTMRAATAVALRCDLPGEEAPKFLILPLCPGSWIRIRRCTNTYFLRFPAVDDVDLSTFGSVEFVRVDGQLANLWRVGL